jgi:hypothetical protein
MRRSILTILGSLIVALALTAPVAAQECEMPPPPPPPASTPSA